MPDRQVRIDLTATDKASPVVDDVADAVEDLEKLDPEVEVTADTDQAERAIAEVGDDARALTRTDQEIVLRAKIGDAKAALKDLQGDLDKTATEARRAEESVDDIGRATGPRLAGNTVADLTGPLGEASGVASDLGGVFDGLGDSAENAWLKMGGSEAGGAAISTVLGGVGFAVAGIAAGWSYIRQQQKKAEEQQKKLIDGTRELNRLMAEGDVSGAAEKILDTYPRAYDAAQKLGVGVTAVTEFLTGQRDVLPGVADEYARYSEIADTVAVATNAADQARILAARSWLDDYNAVVKSRDAYIAANGTLGEQDDKLRAVQTGLTNTKTDTENLKTSQEKLERQTQRVTDQFDKMRGSLNMESTMLRFQEQMDTAMRNAGTDAAATSEDILDIKQSIVDVAEYAGLNPIQVQSLLDRVDQGDLAGVKADVETYYRNSPAHIDSRIDPPTAAELAAVAESIKRTLRSMMIGFDPFGGGFRYQGGAVLPMSAGPVINVTQTVPRGYRGDLLGDAHAASKRTGGLYHRNRR